MGIEEDSILQAGKAINTYNALAKAAMPQSFDDEVPEPVKATFGGIVKQFTLGVVNSALLDFPEFIAKKAKSDLFKESGSKGERIARGTGSLGGFFVGGPAKIVAVGAKAGEKFAEEALIKRAISDGSKNLIKKTVGGSAGIGLYEALKAPTDDFLEKGVTVPLSLGLGGLLGLSEAYLAPFIRSQTDRIKANVSRGTIPEFKKIMEDMPEKIHAFSQKSDAAFTSLLKSKEFESANNFVNTAYAGTKQSIARLRIRAANLPFLQNSPRIQAVLKSGDAADIAAASLENIVSEKNYPLLAYEGLKRISDSPGFNNWVSSARVYLNKQGGPLAQMSKLADVHRNISERRAGVMTADYTQATSHLTDVEKNNLRDSIEGLTLPVNDRVKSAMKEVNRIVFKPIAKTSMDMGVKVNQKDLVREFIPRNNYFPHLLLNPDSDQKIIKESLNAAVKRGDFKDIKSAEDTFKSYVSYIDTRKRESASKLSQWMVDHGIAKDSNSAFTLLKGYLDKARVSRNGNLEYARTFNFPFYDTNLDSAMTRYIHGANTRLTQINIFGRNNEKLKELVNQAGEKGQDFNTAVQLMRRFTGETNQEYAFNVISPETSSALKAFQVVSKLGLSVIPNATQSINPAMVYGLRNTMSAIKESLSGKTAKGAYEFAVRTGGVLESALNEYSSGLGLDGSFTVLGQRVSATKFLKATGFAWVERMNRVISAHAGKNYATEMATRLFKDPTDRMAIRALTNLGLDAKKIIKRGDMTYDELLTAGQTAINKTQFRSGPLDLPLFYSSPEGKIVMQFKSFAFNQAKLIKDTLKDEVLRGNFKPLITAVALMPILGEGVKDVRGILTGQKRDEKGLDRLLDNISAVGAAGTLNDMWNSAVHNNAEGALLGPTGGDLAHVVEGAQQAASGNPKQLGQFALRNIPVAGPALQNNLLPSQRLSRLRDKRKRDRENLRTKSQLSGLVN